MQIKNARRLIKRLSKHFRTPPPRVRTIHDDDDLEFNGRYGAYVPEDQTIHLCTGAQRYVVLHEFAHHLRFMRHGEIKQRKNIIDIRLAHGRNYYRALVDTLKASNTKQYPWAGDYHHLWLWHMEDWSRGRERLQRTVCRRKG